MLRNNFKDKVIEIIKSIPYGYVSTYGTIATLAGSPRSAREVGYLLHALTKKYNLPWQRVINKHGFLSVRGGDLNIKAVQKALLEQEGVEVSQDFMIDLSEYGWFGDEKVVASSQLEIK